MKHKKIVPECQEETGLLCATRLLDIADEGYGHVEADTAGVYCWFKNWVKVL